MASRGVTVEMLQSALSNNNKNDGAGRVRDGEEALLVRAEGRLRSLEEIRSVVIAARDTGIVRVGDVAEVRNGALPRNGVVVRNGEGEAVWGLVLGLRGADARMVVNGVKERLAEIEPTLPNGAKIEIFYDRSELIGKAVWTVQKVLIEAIVLVVILLVLFLGDLRAAIVVSVILPLAALSTFGIMRWWGLSANIMSLGGLAIAIGLLVDCAVVVVENVEHRMAHAHDVSLSDRIFMTLEATREVAVPLTSGVIIIVTVFLPLLSLEGLEGRLFAPVALTIAFALGSALVLSLTVVPALSATLLKPGHADEPWLVRKLAAVYEPLLKRALDKPLNCRRRRCHRPRRRLHRLCAHRPDLYAGDERGHARHHHPQTSDDQRQYGRGDRHAHSARNHGARAGSQGNDGPGWRRRTRHRSRRPQRHR